MLLSNLELTNAKLLRDNEFEFLSPLIEIQNYSTLSFINDIKYLEDYKKNPTITCIICPKNLVENFINENVGIIISENPKKTFYEIYMFLSKESKKESKEIVIKDGTKIHPTAIISKNNIIIGKNVTIGPNCIIEENSIIGNNVVIGPNSLIGVDSFTFEGNNKIVAQRGVIIESDTILLGGIVIEKGVYNDTIIKKNVKVGYNTIIEHDSRIGSESLICSNVTITGRVKIGDNCYLGPGVVIRNGLILENKSRANMGAIVTKNIHTGEQVSGNFAINHREFIKNIKS
ncbi:MAG: DapH/DapD/GlmU-related protein [Bacilli bacterium]